MTFKRIMTFILIPLITFILFGCIEDEVIEEKLSFKEEEVTVVINEYTIFLYEYTGKDVYGVKFSSNNDKIATCNKESDWSFGIKGIAIGETEIVVKVGELKDTLIVKVISKEEAYGAGTKEDPYRISTKEQLLKLAKYEDEHEGKYFKLMNDISFKPYEWDRPIQKYKGNSWRDNLTNGFKGYFDGNYHTINLNKTNFNGFISVNHGVIENLKIISSFDAKDGHRTWLLGFIADINFGTIRKCVATGNVYSDFALYRFGGIAGFNAAIIENCLSDIEVIAIGDKRQIGGITGMIEENHLASKVFNCIFLGSINYADLDFLNIGAIFGDVRLGDQLIRNCHYDLNTIDNKKDSNYFYPLNPIGRLSRYDGFDNEDSVKNVTGISDWSTIDLNEWNLDIWDFSGDKPKLKNFT